MDGEAKERPAWRKDAWRLRICLDVSASRLPAVQYGIFTEDPIEKFKAVASRMEKPWLAHLNEITQEDQRKTVRELQHAWAWTHLFRSISGDEVGLLDSDDTIMSNAPAGKKWLVTKPVRIGGKSLCWSLAFEAIPGQQSIVKVSEASALDLGAIKSPLDLE